MTTRVDTEQMEITRSEKLLTVVLAVFMLIGGLWAYHNVDDIGRPSRSQFLEGVSPAERAATVRHEAAIGELQDAEGERRSALHNLELRREAYRTALEAGGTVPAQPSPLPGDQSVSDLEAAYRQAQARLRDANHAVADARNGVEAAAPAAREARASIEAAHRQSFREAKDDQRGHDRQTFFLRLAIVLAGLAASYWWLMRLRRSRSRYALVSMAGIGASAVLALYLAGDYITDYIEVTDLGVLVLSLAGIALTMAALIALQRYLAKRLPLRRVRKHQCPFCGFPVRAGAHCEGCGRRVVGECTTCHQPRRVGTEHCGACGKA
jgi:hypothetical protein